MRGDHELIARDVEAYLREHEQKQLLRFVAVGSVDDGKSTLIGRLLHDTHGLYEDQLSAVRSASAVRGATRGSASSGEIDFSLFTDGLKAEREQGITIDVAYRYFSTRRRKFIIADTPGHVQYTRNMATGASTADVAVILVDARLGVAPQSRRHAFIASLLGIPHLLVCVNKMDLVGYDEKVYAAIREEMLAFTARLRFAGVEVLPISALRGDNVVAGCEQMAWFTGKTVLAYLEEVPAGLERNQAGLRFPVQYVIRPDLSYRGFAGQVASGVLRRGDEIVCLPSGNRTRVASIDTFEGPLEEAVPPMSVTVRLAEEIDVSRGDMLARPGDLPEVGTHFSAHVVWMSERALDTAKTYLLKQTTRTVRVDLERVVHQVDPDTLAPRPAEKLGLNDIGRVDLRCHRPIFFDAYARNHTTGAFILIDSLTNDTVAAGMILEAAAAPGRAVGARTGVSPEERFERFGHRGAVVEIFAPDVEQARASAFVIERVLFDEGLTAAIVAPGVAGALSTAGLIAVVAADGTPAILVQGEPIEAVEGEAEELGRAVVAALVERGVLARP